MAFFAREDPTEELTQRNLRSPRQKSPAQADLVLQLQRENLYLRNQLFSLVQVTPAPRRTQAPTTCTSPPTPNSPSRMKKTHAPAPPPPTATTPQRWEALAYSVTISSFRRGGTAFRHACSPPTTTASYSSSRGRGRLTSRRILTGGW
jgi:hypothetical protein